jgi:anthranilate 1,2-dioxygenase large subunit
VFQDPAVYTEEQEKIWRGKTWSYVALEAEIPKAGDFKSTFVGDTPVVVTRAADGTLHAWVNRCAHRGAIVCRELRGNATTHTCVYHQWAYDPAGSLVGVPFRRGLGGRGGYPSDFRTEDHGLRRLRIASVGGMVFVTFSADIEPLERYLGEVMVANIRRLTKRPVKILGTTRQYIYSNWKLYAENTRDAYHAVLLHLFYPTFGIARPAQKTTSEMNEKRFHNLYSIYKPSGKESVSVYKETGVRPVEGQMRLEDPTLLRYVDEFQDEKSITIQAIFPSVVVQQILNTLATRQIVPRSEKEFELVWTHFGYEDDDAEMAEHRLRQGNMIGPAGYIAMEDSEATEIVQRGTVADWDESSFVEMAGSSTDDLDFGGQDENAIRGFWKGYREIMGY